MKNSPSPTTVITPAMVAQALATNDDFGHEMRVRAALKRGAYVQHGWTYVDPVEGKPRQFDLRAKLEHAHRPRRIDMAVECKNLAAEAPVVISGTTRTKDEAFHHFVRSELDKKPAAVMDVSRDQLIYPQGKFVGKSIVRLKVDKGTLVPGGDGEIYKGWSQALASADELCKDAVTAFDPQQRGVCTVVLPVVVVPNGTLWTAEYREDGTLQTPTPSDSTTLFLNHDVVVVPRNHWVRLGHVHFYTLKGLDQFMQDLTARGNSWEDWFPDTAERYAPPVH